MPPPDQGLGSRDPPCGKLHERLIIDFEFIVHESTRKALVERYRVTNHETGFFAGCPLRLASLYICSK